MSPQISCRSASAAAQTAAKSSPARLEQANDRALRQGAAGDGAIDNFRQGVRRERRRRQLLRVDGKRLQAFPATNRRSAASRRRRCRAAMRSADPDRPTRDGRRHRPDRSPAARCGILAGGFGRALEHLQVRPRRFGVDVVRCHRRDAAPIVDARCDQPAERAGLRFGGAWMFIAGAKISRATAIVQRWSSSVGAGAPPSACRAWRGNSGR